MDWTLVTKLGLSRALLCGAAASTLLAGCFDPSDAVTTETESSGGEDTESTTAGPTTDTTTGPTATSATTTPTGPTTTTTMPTDPTVTTTTDPTDTTTTTNPTDPTESTSTTDPTDPSETTTDDSDGMTTTEADPCTMDEVCVPAVPADWEGPIVAGADDCPLGYPTGGERLNRGLVPGVPQCSCACNVGSVDCMVWMENSNQELVIDQSCEDPPFDDECISANVSATCNDNGIDVPAVPQWSAGTDTCTGAVAGNACDDGGTCFPADAGTGEICIQRDGDHMCPAGFSDRTLFHRGFADNRDCSACNCAPTGQACEIEVEICSISFYDVTLTSSGSCEQLNSSDGDGVSFFSQTITSQGSCNPTAGSGELSGGIMETGPVTICCS